MGLQQHKDSASMATVTPEGNVKLFSESATNNVKANY